MKKSPAAVAQTATPADNHMDAYTVRKWEDKATGEKKSDWTKVGVAFLHKDGKGINVVLSAFPLDGKVVLRQHEPKENSAA